MTQTPAVERPDVPVFVVGIDNESGEGLTDQLGRHPRLSRVPRTRLLADLDAMLARNQVGLVHYGMPEQYWRKAAAGFHSELQREHASRNGKARWVEFIPSSTLTITQVDRLFPTAQFVHVIAQPRGAPAAGGRSTAGRVQAWSSGGTWRSSTTTPEAIRRSRWIGSWTSSAKRASERKPT